MPKPLDNPDRGFREAHNRLRDIFKNWASNREHAYGEVTSRIPYRERILSENHRKEVLEELEIFLQKEKGLGEEQAGTRARQILDSEPENSIETILEAEKAGYLKDFRLHEPWHPKPFLNGELVTFPFQHDSAVVYTGLSKNIFLSEDSGKRPENSRTSVSALETRKLPATEDHKGYGNYLGFLNVARQYARKSQELGDDRIGGAVFEAQVPVEHLIVINSQPPISQYRSLKDLRKDYGSPEKFWRDCQDTTTELIQFRVADDIPFSWITGVWDTENSEKPVFKPLDDFLENLFRQYNQDLPSEHRKESEELEGPRKQILEELETYRELFKHVENAARSFSSLDGFEDEKKLIKEYNNSLKAAHQLLEEQFGIETGTSRERFENIEKDPKPLAKKLKDAREGLREVLADEQEHAHETDWNREKWKKERYFEQRLEKHLAEKISELPLIQS